MGWILRQPFEEILLDLYNLILGKIKNNQGSNKISTIRSLRKVCCPSLQSLAICKILLNIDGNKIFDDSEKLVEMTTSALEQLEIEF